MITLRRFILTSALVTTALVGLGCKNADSPAAQLEFSGTDITGATFAKEFALTDHSGQPRQLSDFAGKVAVVFFGFTHCPDVCPGAMISMKAVAEKLGDSADQLQVLFITVDPERDTQQVLAGYVPKFDASFIGLRGDIEATKKVAREFKVYFGKVPGTTEGSYTVDHSAQIFVFDKVGKVRLMHRYNSTPTDIANDIQQLL